MIILTSILVVSATRSISGHKVDPYWSSVTFHQPNPSNLEGRAVEKSYKG